MDWSSWFQSVAGGVIDKAAQNRFTQDYDIEKLKLEYLGRYGMYAEGQPMQQPQSGINLSALLIGGAVLVVAVLFLKD